MEKPPACTVSLTSLPVEVIPLVVVLGLMAVSVTDRKSVVLGKRVGLGGRRLVERMTTLLAAWSMSSMRRHTSCSRDWVSGVVSAYVTGPVTFKVKSPAPVLTA